MPQFDLRGIKVAKYINTNGTITHSDVTAVGDAMNVDIQLRFAEGRLYAESTLAEYMRKATGGTISIGVKYIPSAAQKLMFGAQDSSTTVGTATVSGLKYGAKDEAKNVSVAFYAPDMVDGAQKYCCVLINRALFGLPGMTLQTAGENIVFNTPTTTGEFMADHTTGQQMLEIAFADTEAEATGWITAKLGS